MKRVILLFVLLASLICFSAHAEDAQLTLMIYMTGSNLESEYFAATADIQEMFNARYDQEQVNVLIMTGGSEKWWTPGISADHLSIHRIHRASLVLEQDYPLESMASPNPLTSLLNYGFSHFPAQRYALIIWDHGSGPVNGSCMDTLFGGDMLLPAELNAALASSPFSSECKLEWIGFDACLMANAETACLLAPYAKYLIASQETEPGRGWDYSFLKGIEQDTTGADTGRRIADLYYNSAMLHTPNNNITLSVIDLEKINTVQQTADAFFAALNMMLTKDNFSELSQQRHSAQGVGRAADSTVDYDLVDLHSLVNHYAAFAPQEAQALSDALTEAVLYNRSNIADLNGLSIYHPYYNKTAYLDTWRTEYRRSALSDTYLRYLDTYSGIWLGSALTSWTNLLPTCTVNPDGLSQNITLQLTASQVQNFASAELVVLSASDNYGYGFMYREAFNAPDAGGILQISYAGTQLVQTDEEGNPIAAGISYRLQGDRIVLPGVLARYAKANDYKVMFAYLRPRDNEGALEHLYMDEVLDNGYLNSRHNVSLEDWEYFEVLYDNRTPTWDEEGNLLPFEQWNDSSWILRMPLDLQDGMNFRFSTAQAKSDDFVALVQITDTQGNVHSTPLISLQHLGSTTLAVSEQLLLDDAHCSMTLTGAEVVCSELNPVIKLRVRAVNKLDEPLRFSLDYMILNGYVPSHDPYDDTSSRGIAAGETIDTTINIPLAALAQARVSQVNELILYGETCDDDWQSTLPFSTVPLSLDFDFAALMDFEPEQAAIASCEQSGLAIDLLDLSVSEYEAIEAHLRIANLTDLDMELSITDSRINDFCPTGERGSLDLPAGCTGYVTVEFYNRSVGMTEVNVENFCTDLLSAMQISTVSSLSITYNIRTGDEECSAQFTFELTPVFDYAANRSTPMGSELSTLPLYENESIAIRLAGVAIDGTNVNVAFLYENHTDTDWRLDFTHADANGFSDSYSFNPLKALPANTCTLSYIKFTPEGMEKPLAANLSDLTFAFALYDAEGNVALRDEWRLAPCAPAAENKCFYTEQLSAELTSRLVYPNMPIVASALLLPDQAEDFRVVLSASGDSNAVSATANIIFQYDGYYIPIVSGIPMSRAAGDVWQAEYNGLYVGFEQGSDNYWAAEVVSRDENHETWALGRMAAYPSDYHNSSIWQQRTLLDFSPAPVLTVDQLTSAFPEVYTSLYSYANVYVPQRDAAGRLLHMDDLPPEEQTTYRSDYEAVSPPAVFRLLPVTTLPTEAYVLYSFTLADGTGYSAEPIPYGQAISDAE